MAGSKPSKERPEGNGRGDGPGGAGRGGAPGDRSGSVGGRAVVLKAIVIFVVLLGAYYVVEYAFLLDGEFLQSYLSLIASVTGAILNLLGNVLGFEVLVDGRWVLMKKGAVIGRSFGVEIVHGCDAIEPTVAYLAALLASPVAFRKKVPGILVGVPALLIINLFRIVSLFLVGVYYRKALDVMHYDLWQAAFIVLAIVAWAIWVQWATREKAVQRDVSD